MKGRLYFLLIRRPGGAQSPVLEELYDVLGRRGYALQSGIPEEMLAQLDELLVETDLVVLKSHTELALGLASILHDRQIPLLNPYAACIAVQDKILATYRLLKAGIPTPRSWVTGNLSLLHAISEHHPLIIKPPRGFGGQGVQIIQHPRDWAKVRASDHAILAQEYIQGTGVDLKAYVVGERVFAVRKTFSDVSSMQPGIPARVSSEIEEIALKCGRAFGLGLYGLDIVESEDGPVVVDVNYLPGYKGIPGIAPLLADYIEDYAAGRNLPPLPKPDSPVEEDKEPGVL